MARPNNQEARRRELIATTSELLVEHGQSGARLVDIAEASGVTPAAVTYYYADLTDLYADTYATAVAEYITRRRDHLEGIEDPIAQLVECLSLGIPHPGTSSHAATVLLVELSALSTRQERIVASGWEFEAQQLGLFIEILDAGIDAGQMHLQYDTSDTARAILAVEDGIAIPVVAGRLTPADALDITLTAASSLTGTDLLSRMARTES